MEELSQTSTTSQPQESNTLSQPSDVKQNPEAMLNPTNNNLNSQNSDENQYLYKSELFPQNVIPSNSEPLTENKKRPLDEREEHSESTSSPPSKKPRIEEQEKEYNSTVFLGNLPSDVTEGMLSEIFSKVGTVKSVKLNKHADTGKVKGYGFLELATPEEAQRAVNELHGIQILGQAIRVEISIPKHLKAPKWKRSSSSSSTTTTTTTTTTTSSSRHPVTSTRAKVPSKLPKGSSILPPGQETNVVFVGNLSDEVTERDIRELFKRCGPIKEIRWLEDKKTGKFRGCGFVEFYDVHAAYEAIKLDGVRLFGRPIHVDASTPKPPTTSSFQGDNSIDDRHFSKPSSMTISQPHHHDVLSITSSPSLVPSTTTSTAPIPSPTLPLLPFSTTQMLSPSSVLPTNTTTTSTDPTLSVLQSLNLNPQTLQALTAVLTQNALLSGIGGLPLLSSQPNNTVSSQGGSLPTSTTPTPLQGAPNLQNLQGFQQLLNGLLLSTQANPSVMNPVSLLTSATPTTTSSSLLPSTTTTTTTPPITTTTLPTTTTFLPLSTSTQSVSLKRDYEHDYYDPRYESEQKRRSGWDKESRDSLYTSTYSHPPSRSEFDSQPQQSKERYVAHAARTVFIGNIRPTVTDEMIKQIFRDCGRIVAIRWLYDKSTHRFKGCGFVEFDSEEAAVRALQVKAILEGREIYIDSATNSRSSSGSGSSKSSAPLDKSKYVYRREQSQSQSQSQSQQSQTPEPPPPPPPPPQ